jgi:hypothetical protein
LCFLPYNNSPSYLCFPLLANHIHIVGLASNLIFLKYIHFRKGIDMFEILLCNYCFG